MLLPSTENCNGKKAKKKKNLNDTPNKTNSSSCTGCVCIVGSTWIYISNFHLFTNSWFFAE